MNLKFIVPIITLSLIVIGVDQAVACRVNSELLKSYARKTTEHLLDVAQFGSIYWPDEPLPVVTLSKSTGLNITLAETHFDLQGSSNVRNNEISPANEGNKRVASSIIQDIFVTCSVDRDRSYALSVNLELENPFKVIDVYYDSQVIQKKAATLSGDNAPQAVDTVSIHQQPQKKTSLFRIHLPQSSLLIQLNQRIRYDECLTVNYVQLSPTVNYEIECVDCDEAEKALLDKIFSKRMSQLDAELDAILSEKVLFGLQVLLNQQRLELDMYLE